MNGRPKGLVLRLSLSLSLLKMRHRVNRRRPLADWRMSLDPGPEGCRASNQVVRRIAARRLQGSAQLTLRVTALSTLFY